jgi:UDP-galactopyranose mutase
MNLGGLKFVVVGAGFYGAVMAERIAADLGERVLVIEKRDHVGGNCYSAVDPATGIEYHAYGTHIFHTSHEQVWRYIRRFTDFNGFRFQMLTTYQGRVYQLPINLETINAFYGLTLKPYEAGAFLQAEREKEPYPDPKNLEEKAISLVGRPLYEAFIKGYTVKQWRKDPRELPAAIVERLPFRTNYDESYYFARWQGIPLEGYTAIFTKLLAHKNIDVHLKTDFFKMRMYIPKDCLTIYTGPIDALFDYKLGSLEWRTLEFKKEVMSVGDFQGTPIMNFADADIPYTRIHEPRHLHPEREYPADKTLIIREYSHSDSGARPYYPINTPANAQLFNRYLAQVKRVPNMIIGGRLGDYAYYDMDRTILAALETYQSRIKSGTFRHYEQARLRDEAVRQ